MTRARPVFPQTLVRALHVAGDDGDVLEPAIVRSRVLRGRTASGRKELRQFDEFVAEPHPCGSHSQAEHTFQVLVVGSVYFDFRDLFERQHS